jgi:hypothetical protein
LDITAVVRQIVFAADAKTTDVAMLVETLQVTLGFGEIVVNETIFTLLLLNTIAFDVKPLMPIILVDVCQIDLAVADVVVAQ